MVDLPAASRSVGSANRQEVAITSIDLSIGNALRLILVFWVASLIIWGVVAVAGWILLISIAVFLG